MKTVHCASAVVPGLRHEESVAACYAGIMEGYGVLSTAEMQLCPQHHGILTPAVVDRLRAAYPATRFRLHANVRISEQRVFFDASTSSAATLPYFQGMAALSQQMQAPAYTLHAGYRKNTTLEKMRDHVLGLQDLFGVPVGVEGLYPIKDDAHLLAHWTEYEWLLNSDLHYAIDLSHLNIVARRDGRKETALTAELLGNPRCIEVHLSGNNGVQDKHEALTDTRIWWWPLLAAIHPQAVIFSEGRAR